METPIFHFISPPIPYFIDCGKALFSAGEKHISRSSIGVFDLIVGMKGCLPIGEDGEKWLVRKGDILVLRPDGHHYGFEPCRENTEITWIHFQTFGSWQEGGDMDDCLAGQSALIDQHKKNAYLNHCDVNSIFMPKYTQISEKALEDIELFFRLNEEPKSLRNWKRQSIFQLLLQHLDRDLTSLSDATAIQIADKIEWYIRQHYKEPISNSSLRDAFNYHPNYLAKNMLKVYGMTPMEYLQHFRIEQSKKLLLQTSWSIARIAEEAGFQSVSYFSSVFARREGIPPTEFRRKFIANV